MKTLYGFLVVVILVALAAPSVAQEVVSTIAFTSTRDNPDGVPPPLTVSSQLNAFEVYLMDYLGNGQFSAPRRVTENLRGDAFPTLSPDGRGKIVFDSNRRRAPGEQFNVSDLFLMNHDGTEETFLTRGGSPTWSPAGPQGIASKMIAFHASASGTGRAIKTDPGAATTDSDIFVVNVDDLIEKGAQPLNITNDPLAIDDDPDWSPDGEKIAFTSHDVNDDPINSTTAEIYVINPDGTGRQRLTFNTEEERGPNWSPDGTLIVFMCRRGGPDFEICVMNADGTGQTQLTFNTFFEGGPTWSPDGQQIVFNRTVTQPFPQLYVMNANGTGETQLTTQPGANLLASSWEKIDDTTAPVISGIPSAIVVEATSPAGAVGTYVAPTAVDDFDGAVAVTCAPASGSSFSLGVTTVTCTAADAAGNSGAGTFTVTVLDTTPPAISVPDNIVVSPTTATGAIVNYPAATASDLVDGAIAPTCVPAAGSMFSIGSTTVECRATDAHGNTGTGSFHVTLLPLTFMGPSAPYAPPPAWFRAGRTLPVKWQYAGAAGVIDTRDANPNLSISGPLACSATEGDDPIAADAAGNSGYQYDTVSRTWQFNWKVPSTLAAGCYAITIRNQQAGQTDGPFVVRILQ
jgi:Tol biopolymer transport system component